MSSKVLITIAGTFALISMGRIGLTVASAADTVDPAAIEKDLKAGASDTIEDYDKTSVSSSATKTQCLAPDFAAALMEERTRLETLSKDIYQRESAANALNKSLNERIKVLEEANDKLSAQLGRLENSANDDITHLIKMYETMKPKQAATIFNSMDPQFAAGFLRQMNSTQAGLILANMDHRKSYTISAIIANRGAKFR